MTPRMTRQLRQTVVVIGVVTASAGCSSTSAGPAGGAPPAAGDPASSIVAPAPAAPDTVSTPAAASDTRSTPSAVASEAAADPAPVDCAGAPVSMSVPPTRRSVSTAQQTGATNLVALDVTIQNRGAIACTTSGWPTVILRGDACHTVGIACDPTHDVPTRTEHGDGVPTPLSVPPGGTTTFSLVWTGGTLCGAAPAGIDISLPGQPTPVRLAPVDLCSTGDDGSALQVTPLGTLEQWTPGTG